MQNHYEEKSVKSTCKCKQISVWWACMLMCVIFITSDSWGGANYKTVMSTIAIGALHDLAIASQRCHCNKISMWFVIIVLYALLDIVSNYCYPIYIVQKYLYIITVCLLTYYVGFIINSSNQFEYMFLAAAGLYVYNYY